MKEVFISYESSNQRQAEKLVEVLEDKRYDCWIATRDVPKGEPYDDYIPEAIVECKIVVMLFSKASLASPHVKKELRIAVKHGKKIIPFMLEDIQLTAAFEYHIESNNRISADKDWNKAVEELLESMKLEFSETTSQSRLPIVQRQEQRVKQTSDIMDIRFGDSRIPVKTAKDGKYEILCLHCEKNLLSNKMYEEADKRINKIRSWAWGAIYVIAIITVATLIVFFTDIRSKLLLLTVCNPCLWLFFSTCIYTRADNKITKIKNEIQRYAPEYRYDTIRQKLYCASCDKTFVIEVPIEDRERYFYIDLDTNERKNIS